MSRFSSGLFFNVPVMMKCRKDVTPPCCWLENVYLLMLMQRKIKQISHSFHICVKCHLFPCMLLPPPLSFALFLLFYSLCIISHLHNFWRTRIWLINLNNKTGHSKKHADYHFMGWNEGAWSLWARDLIVAACWEALYSYQWCKNLTKQKSSVWNPARDKSTKILIH